MAQAIDIHEAAKILGYKHPNSLRRFLRENPDEIPHRRRGTGDNARYIFVRERLDEYLNGNTKSRAGKKAG